MKTTFLHLFPRVVLGAPFLVTVVTLQGCAKYRAFPISPLAPEFHKSAITTENVSACCEVLDSAASKRGFNKDLTKVGFQPVQFSVKNGGDRHLTLQVSDINLPTADSQAVADRCHYSTAGRATGYGVVGIFIWPFLIPAIVDGVGSAKANGQMDLDFAAKALRDQVIMPYGSANGVLYVPTDQFSPDITLRLRDKERHESLLFRWSNGKPVDGIFQTDGEDRQSAGTTGTN